MRHFGDERVRGATAGSAGAGRDPDPAQDDSRPDWISVYRAASERNDVGALLETLGDNADLVSPLSGRMVFRGREDLRVLLGAIDGSLDDLRWTQDAGGDDLRVVLGHGRVGRLPLSDAMVFELNPDGTIHRVRPHLRPWLATTALALRLGPKLARHPGVLWRAWQRP